MNIWRTLFWKECHEQKWKLLSLMTIVLSVLVAAVAQPHHEVGLLLLAYCYVFFVPLFIAMGVSSAERSTGSISFVNALPIPRWKAGFARILTGWLVLIIPILAASAICLLIVSWIPISLQGFKSLRNSILEVDARLVFTMATSFYAWILAITTNQRTELRTGILGLLTIVLLFFFGVTAFGQLNDIQSNAVQISSSFTWFMLAVGPMMWVGLLQPDGWEFPDDMLTFVLVTQILTILFLVTWSVLNYGRRSLFEIFSFRTQQQHIIGDRLMPPMKSPVRALLWMQLRESVPLAVSGVAIVVMLVYIEGGSLKFVSFRIFGNFVGGVLALTIGIGAFVHPLQPDIHTFWRSRPISPRQWFWMKASAGALVIVCCFNLPLFALQQSCTVPSYSSAALWGYSQFLVDAAFAILLNLFIYSVAVLASCGIRHPVYSVILGIAGIMLVMLPPQTIANFPESISFAAQWDLATRTTIGSNSWSFLLLGALMMAPLIAGSMFLAAWLVRRDVFVSH